METQPAHATQLSRDALHLLQLAVFRVTDAKAAQALLAYHTGEMPSDRVGGLDHVCQAWSTLFYAAPASEQDAVLAAAAARLAWVAVHGL